MNSRGGNNEPKVLSDLHFRAALAGLNPCHELSW